ncbi:MAG: ferrochelatase [Pyrinomonadaceae bacterium]
MRIGILLINLGTPDAPTPQAVGRYLREFLMDPFVIDSPTAVRWFLVNVLIVPKRKYQSAAAYQKVQMREGSPLLVHTRALAERVRAELNSRETEFVVDYAMRYGNPSIESSLGRINGQNVSQIIVLPLYPQYAESSFETAVVETKKRAAEVGCADRLRLLSPFYDQSEFINAFARHVSDVLEKERPDHLLFSFHSLPEKHVTRLYPRHCLRTANCCDQITESNRNCYRAQCLYTAKAIAQQVGWTSDRYSVSFQSRLGRAKWLGPNTEEMLKTLATGGVKRLAVACPSFVADCLETLEEIAIRGRQTFIAAGGDELQLVGSLNSDPVWVEAVAKWVEAAARAR